MLNEPLCNRDRIIKELIDFEKKTVKRLSTLKKELLLPLQDCLKPSYHACIFYKVEVSRFSNNFDNFDIDC